MDNIFYKKAFFGVLLLSFISVSHLYTMDPPTLEKEEEQLIADVREGNENAVIGALAKGIDPKNITVDGKTLLHMAAEAGHAPIIRLLRSAYLDVDAVDNDGNTALHIAVIHDHPDVVEALLKGEYTRIVAPSGCCIARLCQWLNREPIVPARYNIKNNQKELAVHIAARNDNAAILHFVDLDGRNGEMVSELNTALCIAAAHDNLAAVNVLANHTYPLTHNSEDRTPLEITNDPAIRTRLRIRIENVIHAQGEQIERYQRQYTVDYP